MLDGSPRAVERILRPPLAVLMPIPSLGVGAAVVPWFGIGNVATVLIVVYASTFPLLYNVWNGCRRSIRCGLRAAQAMNAEALPALSRDVIWRAALPSIITGIRLALGVHGSRSSAASSASPQWGLGKLIFDAKEYLNAT